MESMLSQLTDTFGDTYIREVNKALVLFDTMGYIGHDDKIIGVLNRLNGDLGTTKEYINNIVSDGVDVCSSGAGIEFGSNANTPERISVLLAILSVKTLIYTAKIDIMELLDTDGNNKSKIELVLNYLSYGDGDKSAGNLNHVSETLISWLIDVCSTDDTDFEMLVEQAAIKVKYLNTFGFGLSNYLAVQYMLNEYTMEQALERFSFLLIDSTNEDLVLNITSMLLLSTDSVNAVSFFIDGYPGVLDSVVYTALEHRIVNMLSAYLGDTDDKK